MSEEQMKEIKNFSDNWVFLGMMILGNNDASIEKVTKLLETKLGYYYDGNGWGYDPNLITNES